MASPNTIDTAMAKRLHEAAAIRGVTIIGIPGGWSVLLKLGMNERPLGTQRTNKVRSWRSLDTLMAYLRSDLGITRIDGVDASGHSASSVFKQRPDTSARMRQAHAGLAENWATALASMPNLGNDEDFERRGVSNDTLLSVLPEDKQQKIREGAALMNQQRADAKKLTVDQLINRLTPDRQKAVLDKAENISQSRVGARKQDQTG